MNNFLKKNDDFCSRHSLTISGSDQARAEYVVDFLPKVKIEVVLADDMLDSAIEAICTAAKTDKIGDGKIFVSTVEQAIRIRTGETGDDAI
jgi:nitrogen regulatory protein P-II 1